jgi:hypothetical protein
MSYMTLRGRWCNIIVLNVHAPREDKSDDVKDKFYEEIARVYDQIFSNRQSEMRVYMKLVMIMELE